MSARRERTRYPGIYKRGSRYVYNFKDNRGKPRSRSAATLAEAKAARSAALADVARGEFRALSNVEFADYAAEWIESYTGRTKHGIGEDTRADYRKVLERDATPFFGRMRLAEIDPRDVKRYATKVASRGVSRDTVRLALAPVKAMLATAVEEGLIRSNPSAGLRNILPPSEGGDAETVKALAEDELARLLDELPGAWRLFFEFLAETGLRIGEAIEVRFGDFENLAIDVGPRWLLVHRRFYRGRVALPKGRKSRRVQLRPRMAAAVREFRDTTGASDGDLVFTAGKGARIDQSNLMSRVLKPAAVRAGLGEWVGDPLRAESWVGFHAFRHTCGRRHARA